MRKVLFIDEIEKIRIRNLYLEQQYTLGRMQPVKTIYQATADAKYRETGIRPPTLGEFYTKNNHAINMILAIGVAFIPFIGPVASIAISTGIAALDAYQFYEEGDPKSAGMSAMFALLPLIKPVATSIPLIKQLGVKGMAKLGDTLTKGSNRTLSQTEAKVLEEILEKSEFVTSETNKVLGRLKNVVYSGANKGIKFTWRTAKVMGPYILAGVVYDQVYDYFNPEEEFRKIGVVNQDATRVDTDFNKIKLKPGYVDPYHKYDF